MVGLIGDELKSENILKVVDDIADYGQFKTLIELGFQVHHSEIPFDKIMMFSWIKEALENGRKN